MTLILLALTFLRRKIWDGAYLHTYTFPPESEVKKVHGPFFYYLVSLIIWYLVS